MIDLGLQLEMTRPWMLAILLVAVPVVVWYFIWSLVDFRLAQRVSSLVTRLLIVTLLTLALTGLTLMTPTREQFLVFVIDDSLSVGEEGEEAAADYIRRAIEHQQQHEVRYLSFARQPGRLATEREAARKKQTASNASPQSSVDASSEEPTLEAKEAEREARLGSNLAAAIEVATASIPPFYLKQIVLLSDGNQTHGDAVQAALAAGVPISTVPLPDRSEPEVQVSSVKVPAQVRQGEPFFVEVVIDSNHDDEGYIEVFRGPHKVGEPETPQTRIRKGENRFRFRETGTNQRLLQYTVRIRGFQDRLLDNNAASGLVFTAGKPRVLLIDSDTKTTRALQWGLQEHEITVDVRPPQGTPDSLAELQNYEVVMLSNVPATALTLRQMEVLRTYVEVLGGGLIMLGGDQSFGLGGYYKTTLEEILPVRSNFEKEKEKPSLAMVLIVDKSGSMGGLKMELAKDATKSAVELLGPRDQVGVVAFDGGSYWVSEIHSAADKNYVIDRVSTIQAGGGTSIYPAMEDAYEALSTTTAKLKHVILLSDGHSSPGDFEGIANRMAAARMTVSTVAVGTDADLPLLETIARLGHGRYYQCDDPQSVPQIFAKETVTASKSAINEEPFLPQVIRPTQVLREIDLESAPFLLGFVVTRPKPTSEFILATESGEPLLVWWRYGLGMTVAYTSDAKSRWAAEWLSWRDFGKFWAQIVRHVMRKSEAKGVFVDVRQDRGNTQVTLDAADALGQFRNHADTRLTIIDPQLGNRQQTMAQIAPGRYQTDFATLKSGTYHLELAQMVNGQTAFRQTRGLVVGYPEELRLRPANDTYLEKIAQVSGGRYNPPAETIFEVGEQSASRALPLWPYLLMAAALLLVLDVALRRIDWAPTRSVS